MQINFPVVLLAEDDPFILSLLATVARRAGWNATMVQDGNAALASLIANEPDALILDLLLPRVDGFGVLRHLRDTQSPLLRTTIVISGAPEHAILARTSLDDVCCFLSKPIDIDALLRELLVCEQRVVPRKGPQPASRREQPGKREVS